jgi:MerR family transcriptional regulator, mercuric resistance operon regulatory protein
MTQKSFTIGALAKNAGVNIETVRFYQMYELRERDLEPIDYGVTLLM